MAQAAPVENALPARLSQLARTLESRFLGKDEVIRLLLIAVVAGEHAVLVGPPGTAKSALIRMFARLLQANYFEYLLTRFTEPNEIFGPVDIAAFREGRYQRRVEGMLPDGGDRLPRRDLQVELRDPELAAHAPQRAPLHVGRRRSCKCPLLSCFGASNEVPNDETLTAIFDRFLLRIRVGQSRRATTSRICSRRASQHEIMRAHRTRRSSRSSRRARSHELHRAFAQRMRFTEEFFSQYKGLVFQIRAEGVSALRPPRREAAQAVRRERVPRRARSSRTRATSSC